MSLRKLIWSALPVAAALAVWVAGSPAHAASLALNFDNGANTKGPFTNPGAAPVDNNFFQTTLMLDNGSVLQVAANVNMNINISANLGVTGATYSPTGNLNIPFQSPSLSAPSQNVYQDPSTNGGSMGSAQLTLWDQQVGGFDPGGDGGNPNPLATMPSTLSRADMNSFKATLIGATGYTLTTNPLTITGSGNLTLATILGQDLNLPLDLKLLGNAAATLKNLTFTQTTTTDALAGNGTPNLLPPGNNATRTYPLGSLLGNVSYGDISGDVDLAVGGVVQLDAGFLGSFNFNLGNLITANQKLAADFPLPGQVKLADLNPTGYNPVNYDDLQATIGLDLTGIGLPFSLASVGTATLSTFLTTTTNLIAPLTITFSVTGTITFGILASLVAQDTVYQLQDSIANVVAPEPGSIILLFMGLAGAVPLVLRRRRRRKS
jgi:hypothetical protein